MKKVLYMTAIAALAMVSCTKDNTKEVNLGHAIDFRVATTRATETTTDNLNKIWVTALSETTSHFTEVEFAKEGTYFVTPNAYYWPADGSSLTFYAYAPSEQTIGGVLTLDATAQTLTGFAPAADVKDQIDFVAAVATGNKADNEESGVELIFDHALTQIEIQAYSNNTGYVHKVKGVRIANVGTKGDYNFKLFDWTLADGFVGDYTITYDTAVTLESEPKNIMGDYGKELTDVTRNGCAMIIPQKLTPWDAENDETNEEGGSYIEVLVNIETADGAVVYPTTQGDYGWVAFPLDGELIRGFKYIYKIDFTEGSGYVPPTAPDGPRGPVVGDKIQFTHEIASWSVDSSLYDTDIEMK